MTTTSPQPIPAGGDDVVVSAAHTTSVIARSGFFESQSGFVHTRIVSWLVGPATVAIDLTRTSRTGAVHTRHGAGPLFTTFSAIAILPKETRDPAPQAITILENDQMDQPRPPSATSFRSW